MDLGINIQELEHMRKLFIGGLDPKTTPQTLDNYFSKYGKVVEAKVMTDQNGKTRGFGFITYEKSSMVDKAQDGRPHEIDGKSVESKRVIPRTDSKNDESRVTVKKLFVGGVKNDHDEDTLRDYFRQFGTILSVEVAKDNNTGRRKGYAFVEYDDYDSADKAILRRIHVLKGIPIDVKKALTKQMVERLNRGHNNNNNMGNNMGPQHNMPPNNMMQPNNMMPPNNNMMPNNNAMPPHNMGGPQGNAQGPPQWFNNSGYMGNGNDGGNMGGNNPPNPAWSNQNHSTSWKNPNSTWNSNQNPNYDGQNGGYNSNQMSSWNANNSPNPNNPFSSQPKRNFQNRPSPYPNKKANYSSSYSSSNMNRRN